MTRIAKDPDVRRGELVACALDLFYKKGYENTAVSDIVDGAHVAKGTFYYYFDSKLAILEAAVDELISHSLALIQGIVDDEQVAAIPKWTQAMQVLNQWKAKHKDELLTIVEALYKEENALLNYKIQSRMLQMGTEELAKIIVQGVDEGAFDTSYARETAEIALAITQRLSDSLVDLLLNPQDYNHPTALARRKIAAGQAALERVLGAPPGSLPLVDSTSFTAWFEDLPERV